MKAKRRISSMSALTLDDLNKLTARFRDMPPVAEGISMNSKTFQDVLRETAVTIHPVFGVSITISSTVPDDYCNVSMSDGTTKVIQIKEFIKEQEA